MGRDDIKTICISTNDERLTDAKEWAFIPCLPRAHLSAMCFVPRILTITHLGCHLQFCSCLSQGFQSWQLTQLPAASK